MPTMSEFTAAYGVRANTIRRWTDTYAPYFSEGAKPPKGKTRRYSYDDADVIDLIASMRSEEDRETGEILNALKAGKRGSWPRDAHETLDNEPGRAQRSMTRNDAMLAELSHRTGYLEGQVAAITEERNYLRGQVAELQDQVGELKDQLRLLSAPKEETPADMPEETPQEHEFTTIQIVEDSADISSGISDWIAKQPEPSLWQRLKSRLQRGQQ